MSRISFVVLFLLFVSTSCSTEQKKQIVERIVERIDEKDTSTVKVELVQNPREEIKTAESEKIVEIESDHPKSFLDSIPSFNVDDYPVTNSMFKSAKYPTDERVLYFDGLWFSNGNQTLAIALYTDFYRYAIFHFRDDFVPVDLIDKMVLHKPLPDNDVADLELKRELFPNVFPKYNQVDSTYFTSNKGFKLGDSKRKAIDEYGLPDNIIKNGKVEILHWEFIGDEFYDGKQDLKGKPLAKNSFGHQIKMYFENEKLIGLFLHNDIP